MKNNSIITFLILLGFCTFFNLKSQTNQYDEKITVVAPYKPSVPDANKINILPEDITIELKKEKPDYDTSVVIPKLSKYNPNKIETQPSIANDNTNAKKHLFYGKFGFGSNIEPLADIYVNSFEDKKLGGGFHLRHNSAWRQMQDVYDNSFSNSEIGLYGKLKFNNYQLKANTFYSHKLLHYYGFDGNDTLLLPNADDNFTAQVRQTYGGELIFNNIISYGYDYKIALQYVGMNIESMQINNDNHELLLPVDFSYYTSFFSKSKKEDLNIKFFANYLHSSFKNNCYNTNDFLLTLEPSYSLSIGAFDMKLGFNTNLYNENIRETDTVKVDIHAVAEIKTTIVPDAFSLKIGINGSSERNSIRKLYSKSKYYGYHYFNDVPDLLYSQMITEEKYNIYAFFDTRFGNYINFSAGVELKKIEDFPVFCSVKVADQNNYYPIIFQKVDFCDMNKVSISADFTFDTKKDLYLNLQGKYNFIDMDLDEITKYPFNVPDFEIYLFGKYTFLNKKMSLAAQAFAMGKLKDKDVSYYKTDEAYRLLILPVMYDLGLSCTYHLKQNLDLWLNLNNLLHYSNKLYLYQLYPEYPANAMIGVTISL